MVPGSVTALGGCVICSLLPSPSVVFCCFEALLSWPGVVAANDIVVSWSGVPRIVAADIFMRELFLGISGGELGRALVGVI